MKTSSNITQQTEAFLLGNMAPTEAVVFQAKLLLDPILKMNTQYQKKVYELVRYYGRRNRKARIERIHSEIFSDPAKRQWQHEINNLFKGNR